MRVVGGSLRGRLLAAPKSPNDPPDRRPAARSAVQHSGPCLWRSDHRRAGARSVCRHRRARHRSAVARRSLCAVRRRRRGGARAASRECRDARPRRHVPYLPPRRHQAWAGAPGRAVRARLPRPALRQRPRREGAGLGARRGMAGAGCIDRRRGGDQGQIRRAGRLYRARTAQLRRYRVRLAAAVAIAGGATAR